MKNSTVSELETLLKGEQMASDSYNKFIQNAKDENIKKQLQSIQQTHKKHAMSISTRLQDLGVKPHDGVGISGKIAEFMSEAKDSKNKDTSLDLEKALSGESSGIRIASEMVKGDLDAESSNLVNTIIEEDKKHLTTLATLINQP